MSTTRRDLLRGALCLGGATAAWTSTASWFLTPPSATLFQGGPLPTWGAQLVEANLHPWESGDLEHLAHAGATNPEWDFMGRTFFGLALANLALREPDRAPRYLAVLDAILDDTLAVEADRGFTAFLMSYGRFGGWVRQPAASLFVDGEIAALLAARMAVGSAPEREPALRARLNKVSAQMRAGPLLSAESYPNECWTFCNTFGLAALRLGEAVGVPVDPRLPDAWIAHSRAHLLDGDTGLLPSSYTLDGRIKDGPEGSSIWLSAHNLLLVDPDFARMQYTRARDHLSRDVLGFGYAREWPEGAEMRVDVDSGPVIPVLGASPGSSGLALVAARAFGDRETYESLTASLELAAFPEVTDGRRRYLASNAVGDAVLLYSAVQGPLWDLARRRNA